MNFKKRAAKIGLPMILVMLIALNTNAATFTDKYLRIAQLETDLVTNIAKTGGGDPTIHISNIKKGNGDKSNYQKIWCFVYWGGYLPISEHIAVTVSKTKTLRITNETKKKKGTQISVRAYGNNPVLDCKVSGTFTPN